MVVLALGVEGEMWNTIEHSVVVEKHYALVNSAAKGNFALPDSTTN